MAKVVNSKINIDIPWVEGTNGTVVRISSGAKTAEVVVAADDKGAIRLNIKP